MPAIIVNENRELVIPSREVDELGLKPGQQVALIRWKGSLQLVPVPELSELRGALPNLEPFDRDAEWHDANR